MSEKYTSEELTALAVGELDEIRSAEIEGMLSDDPEGRQMLDDLRSVAGILSEEFATEEVIELTAAQKLAVQSADPDRRAPLRLPLPLSIAASILMLLGMALLLRSYYSPQTTTTVGKPVAPVPDEEKVPLMIEYPQVPYQGTPPHVEDPHVAPPSYEPPKTIYVPKGTRNLARGKAVTSNAKLTASLLKKVTDGDKSYQKGHYVELGTGLKWVQIDLGTRTNIYAVAIWHYCDNLQGRAYRDVIVQVSNDPNFSKYTTVFNTDHDKSAGLEVGSDMGYVETMRGKVIECKGVPGRYVRLYSKGNTSDDQNHYIEVEVHGKKATANTTTIPTPTVPFVQKLEIKPARAKKVPFVIKYPIFLHEGTPAPVNEPNVRKLSRKKPATPMMPAGTVNLALGKPVTSNELQPNIGTLEMVTDGEKSGEDGNSVDIGFGLKWVQVDLQAVCDISAIGLWHHHKGLKAYRDVIVHVS
ncbi:MAG: discoidin domain-containing protein, partial [bacterium]|nr:discoidin domain-containing protein [bacterium]